MIGRAALCAALAASVAVPVLPVLAEDNSGLSTLTRRDQLFGWEGVGRIDIKGGGFCTGTLIATDLVLTAAHCVFGADGQPVAAGRMTFRAGLSGNTAIAEVPVMRTVTVPEYQPATEITAGQLRIDVALLQLQTPILAAVAAPFTVDSPGDGAKVSVVSYAEGREDVLSWQKVCSVLGKAQGLIAVDCDVTFGASGAPVLDRSYDRARIVSIISGGTRGGPDGTVAYGMELPRIVGELKTLLREGKAVSVAETEVSPDTDEAVTGTKAPAKPTIRRLGAGDTSRDISARFVKP